MDRAANLLSVALQKYNPRQSIREQPEPELTKALRLIFLYQRIARVEYPETLRVMCIRMNNCTLRKPSIIPLFLHTDLFHIVCAKWLYAEVKSDSTCIRQGNHKVCACEFA